MKHLNPPTWFLFGAFGRLTGKWVFCWTWTLLSKKIGLQPELFFSRLEYLPIHFWQGLTPSTSSCSAEYQESSRLQGVDTTIPKCHDQNLKESYIDSDKYQLGSWQKGGSKPFLYIMNELCHFRFGCDGWSTSPKKTAKSPKQVLQLQNLELPKIHVTEKKFRSSNMRNTQNSTNTRDP